MNFFAKNSTMKTASLFSLLLLLLASVSLAQTLTLNVSGASQAYPNSNVTLTGVFYADGTGSASKAITATMPASAYNRTNTTDSNGAFSVIATTPSTTGDSNVTITATYAEGSTITKDFGVRVSSVNTAEIFFIGAQPPFNASTRFQARILLKNSSSQPLASYSPLVQVYAENSGSASGWTLANQSATTNASGEIIYNITSPSSAAGNYMLIVERGKGMRGLMISSGVSMSVSTLDSAGSQATDFAPGETVTIQAKLTNLTGSITGASPVASITLPNGTVTVLPLPANPDSENYSGYYNASYTTPASVSGEISIDVSATINRRTEESRVVISVKSFTVEVSDQQDFFKEFGGKKGIPPGGQVGLDVLVINISTDQDVEASLDGTTANSANCSNISLARLWNVVNGTNYSATLTRGIGMDMMQAVCKISFNAPNAAATYGVTVNVSYKGGSETGTGYFAAQNYFLSVAPQISTGGEMEFMPMALPNANTTLQISAWNLSSNTAVPKALIQSIMATKITPLMFMGGGSAANTTPSYWATGSGSTSPHINVTTLSFTGPQLIEVNSSIGGEQVTGSGFIITKYIMGFLMPMSTSGGMGGGGTSCSGNITFMGMVKDIRTNQMATGASITDIFEARNEMTGQNIRNCLNLTPATTTSGQANVTISVNASCSLSGFYFALVNVTYQGMTDFIPSGFSCKTIDFWPEVTTSQGFGWRVAPSSCVNISVTRITKLSTRANVTAGNLSITRVANMNPGKGGKILQNSVSLSTNLTSPGSGASGTGTVMICPQNFTLGGQAISSWPNGNMEITVQVCENSSNACDTSWSGMRITPFDMWIERQGWQSTFAIGSNQSVIINVKANVSPSNASAFVVTVGRPWEGSMLKATVAEATLLNDGWNSSEDNNRWDGRERWNVTFTIPVAVKKGGAQITFEVNGSTTYGVNETATDDMWGSLQKYIVLLIPDENIDNNMFLRPADSVQDNNTLLAYGINLTVLQQTYGLASQSNTYVLSTNNFTLMRNTGQGDVTTYYGNNTALLVFDNLTAGVCDTVVLRKTAPGGYLKILSINSSFAGRSVHDGLRLKSIVNCFRPTFVNSTAALASYQQSGSTSNWGGSNQYNVEFTIPYMVVLNSQAVGSKNVSINAVIQQRSEGSGNSGVGMEGSLTSENYSSTSAVTGSDGIAFVKLKANVSGRLMAFWKIANETETEDIASMESGTTFKILQFDTQAGSIYSKPVSTANLVLSDVGGFMMMNGQVWNGTLVEQNANDFIPDGQANTHYISVDASNELRINTDQTWGNSGSIRLFGIGPRTGPGAECNAPGTCTLGIPDNVDLITANLSTAGVSTYRIRKTGSNPGGADVAFLLNLSTDDGTTFVSVGPISILNSDSIGTESLLANPSNASRVFAGIDGILPVRLFPPPGTLVNPGDPFLEVWAVGDPDASHSTCSGGTCYLNSTLTPPGLEYKVGAFTGNSTHKTIAFFQKSPTAGNPFVQSSTQNVSVYVCAQTFDQPNARPIEGLNVNLTLEYFQQGGMGGQQQHVPLTMYSPATNNASTNITTGPSGCVGLKAGPPEGGWQSCSTPQTIMAAVGNSTHSQADIWVSSVFRQCNWGSN
ncbi:hypothetical protein HY992_03245 [Candidatus Micrarchaeota archaeon]|nr:hypothetical protein [Candidatus Micrarchaeota archaeon]